MSTPPMSTSCSSSFSALCTASDACSNHPPPRTPSSSFSSLLLPRWRGLGAGFKLKPAPCLARPPLLLLSLLLLLLLRSLLCLSVCAPRCGPDPGLNRVVTRLDLLGDRDLQRKKNAAKPTFSLCQPPNPVRLGFTSSEKSKKGTQRYK